MYFWFELLVMCRTRLLFSGENSAWLAISKASTGRLVPAVPSRHPHLPCTRFGAKNLDPSLR